MKHFIFPLLLLFPHLTFASDCNTCDKKLLSTQPQVPETAFDLVTIEKAEYERNSKASYCKRPIEMVDTIVLHHSETANTDTPKRMNDLHLARGSSSDPWLMVAYSYIVNAPYAGAESPSPRVTEGRPLEIVGAHAGSNVFTPMNASQKKMFDDGKITCGTAGGAFKVNDNMVKDGKIKANVTTIGLVVIGNYLGFGPETPGGPVVARHPTAGTKDLIARTACQLQKKYPNMKNIKWHSYYHGTDCPGTIKEHVSEIITLTGKYGCEFK